MVNKVDVQPWETLDSERKALVNACVNSTPNFTLIQTCSPSLARGHAHPPVLKKYFRLVPRPSREPPHLKQNTTDLFHVPRAGARTSVRP